MKTVLTRILWGILSMAMSSVGLSQCTLTVLESPAVHDTNLTTFRFYINLENANDQVSAVWGNDDDHLVIHAPQGVFNSAFNSSWNASWINPAFVWVFPEVADDTYATIGLDGPAATSSLEAAVDPTIVEDEAQPITPFFVNNGATELVSNSHIGSAWYVLNTASNGLPDENLQVIILQVTTAGGISGKINYQVFPLGVGENAEYYSIEFDGTGTFGGDGTGCTDLTACNFDAQATEDDGSCTYIPEGDCDCDGNVLDALGECGGDCLADSNGDGICDGDEVLGCINYSACNYNPDANLPDPEGPCAYPEPGFCCDGSLDVDEDGVCDEDEIAGCTDPFACNYDSAATDEDGTCEYCDCSDEAYTLTVESAPAIQAGLTTYRLYVNMNGENDFLSAVYGVDDQPLQINAPEGAFNSEQSLSWSAAGVNPGLFIAYPELQDDSYATIGLSVSAALLNGTEQDPALTEGSGNEVFHFFTTDGATSLASSEFLGSSWYVLAGASNGFADPQGRVLIMQVTTAGSLSGTLSYQIFADGNQDNDIYVTSTFDGVGTFGQTNVCGCMEANACNYDEAATIDDSSCEYESCDGCMDEEACNYDPDATIDSGNNCLEEDAIDECGGDCFADADDDGVCDEVVLTGCTDPDACNYVPEANTNDGSCTYAEQYYDCDGNCLMDTDMDGVCDELEVAGCTDETACNYNELATDDDGMCEYAEEFYDCEGNCLNDADEDGVCDELEVAGCTLPFACNYDSMANVDDGSCEFSSCLGCTDPEACNFDASASVDNGQCQFTDLSFELLLGTCHEDTSQLVVFESSDDELLIQLQSSNAGTFTPWMPVDEGLTFALESNETYVLEALGQTGCIVAVDFDTPRRPRPITPYASVVEQDDGNLTGEVRMDSLSGGIPPFVVKWFHDSQVTANALGVNPLVAIPSQSLDSLPAGAYRVHVKDSRGCEGDSLVEILDVAVYGCQSPNATNFNPAATVDDGSCLFFDSTCTFLNDDAWSAMTEGIYPFGITAFVAGEMDSAALVVSLPELVVEDAGGTFEAMTWSFTEATGLPAGLSVLGLPEGIEAGTQKCIQVQGTAWVAGDYELTLKGVLTISLFGVPFEIDPFEFSHPLRILEPPSPIEGCTYPMAVNYFQYAELDDGSCVLEGCSDPSACNYLAWAEGNICSYACHGCTYPQAINFDASATFDDGSCSFDPPASCIGDLNGDDNVGSSDLLSLLSAFGGACLNSLQP
jgi:hypothetical protein